MIRFCLKTKKEVITVLRKKRWVRYALVFCLCSIMATGTITAKAEEADTSGARIMPQEYIDAIEDTDPLRDFVPPNIDFMCEPLVTRSTTISVPVTEPCDQEWRATYPDNWMWQANRAIRDAAAPLKDFGIQYYSVSQKYWDSSSTTSSALVQEAKDEGTAIDATYGRKTRAVLIMDSGHIVLSSIQPETVAGRLEKDDENISVDDN